MGRGVEEGLANAVRVPEQAGVLLVARGVLGPGLEGLARRLGSGEGGDRLEQPGSGFDQGHPEAACAVREPAVVVRLGVPLGRDLGVGLAGGLGLLEEVKGVRVGPHRIDHRRGDRFETTGAELLRGFLLFRGNAEGIEDLVVLCLIEDYLLGEPDGAILQVLDVLLRVFRVVTFRLRGALDGVPDQAGAGGRGELVVGVKRGEGTIERLLGFGRELAGPIVLVLGVLKLAEQELIGLDLFLEEPIEHRGLAELGWGVVGARDSRKLALQVRQKAGVNVVPSQVQDLGSVESAEFRIDLEDGVAIFIWDNGKRKLARPYGTTYQLVLGIRVDLRVPASPF